MTSSFACRRCRAPSAIWRSRSRNVRHAAERDPDQWETWREALDGDDPAALAFVEENGTNLAIGPYYGRAPCGERVVVAVPLNHGKNTTLVAAPSLDGITTLMMLEGAMDGDAFDVFVAEALVPTLRPGQVVIGDTRNVPERDAARQLSEGRSCQLLWLPPYSPDLAPIEQAFSTRKTALRRAEARNRAALEAAIGAADAQGWLAHCIYRILSCLI